MTEPTKSKYQAQINYIKNRRETDDEFRNKHNELVRNRYNNNPEYREYQKNRALERYYRIKNSKGEPPTPTEKQIAVI